MVSYRLPYELCVFSQGSGPPPTHTDPPGLLKLKQGNPNAWVTTPRRDKDRVLAAGLHTQGRKELVQEVNRKLLCNNKDVGLTC